MAVVWDAKVNDTHYQVRTAGRSVRLYTDGVFHSQWNPSTPISGHLWDLLLLPVFFHTECDRVNQVLVLGVGGGAVINLLNRFLSPTHIVGVDMDRQHLTLAKQFFVESTDNVTLIENDAQVYLHSLQSRNTLKTFDFIVEDIFCGAEHDKSDAVRAVEADERWMATLRRHLSKEGVLAMNFESSRQLKRCLGGKKYQRFGFQSLYQLSIPRYENAIAVLLAGDGDRALLDKHIERYLFNRSIKGAKNLNYLVKRIT